MLRSSFPSLLEGVLKLNQAAAKTHLDQAKKKAGFESSY